MIIYYSGQGEKANPEYTLQDEATLMLTFIDFYNKGQPKPNKRFRKILKKRKSKKRRK